MISFIVIGRNEGWKLKACLDALSLVVYEDNIHDYEVIYVDSQSTDDSISVAKQYPKVRVFLVTGDCNAGVGRNIGAKEAKGDVLCFLDGDMELQCGIIPELFNENGKLKYPFYSGLHLNRVYHNSVMKEEYLQKSPSGVCEYLEIATGGLMIIERQWWDELHGIDTRFRYNEDYDFGLRMTERGVKPRRQCKLWVIHNTYPHVTRDTYVSSAKYTALLFRNHWFNSEFLSKKMFPTQHTAFALLICLVGILVGYIIYPSFWWTSVLFGYLLVLFRKAKKQNEVELFKMIWLVVKRDIVFLISIVCFWPKAIELKYEEK